MERHRQVTGKLNFKLCKLFLKNIFIGDFRNSMIMNNTVRSTNDKQNKKIVDESKENHDIENNGKFIILSFTTFRAFRRIRKVSS